MPEGQARFELKTRRAILEIVSAPEALQGSRGGNALAMREVVVQFVATLNAGISTTPNVRVLNWF